MAIPHWLTNLLPAVLGLIGAIIGASIAPIVTYWISRKQQRLELYKALYPQLMTCGSELLEHAEMLRRSMILYHENVEAEPGCPPEAMAMRNVLVPSPEDQLAVFVDTALRTRWILGPEIYDETCKFHMQCAHWLYELKNSIAAQDSKEASKAYYERLNNSVSKRLHIEALTRTFRM